ncbi:[FeFe] hydrogenase H-cluster radical SAM maturase HydE [Melioribacteraceae bacterium 4301-Me]|uniref:[FeFe] hydrogenase H-cluster radical SAM maturase HydE n=1 Tax=Pyranulibacter aquaticus TaxID=3163344 RepID=UPI003599F359
MNLKELLHKESFTREEIISLLKLQKGEEIRELINRADEVRREYCGEEVHLRGIIEFSNYCTEDCLYCGLRAGNLKLQRYRMSPEEIIETAKQISNLGIFTIVLQSGEDSYYDKDLIAYIIYSIKQYSDVAITLSIGEREFDEYRIWKLAGADRYLLKHETANPKLYSIYHNKQKLEDRIKHLEFLKSLGYQIGSGNIVGLPMQTEEDIADDILLCSKLDLDMAAFGPFIPAPNTPYRRRKAGNVMLTLKTMAVARIVLKNVHIPATTALATIDEAGRIKGLTSGANVIMPDFTPMKYRQYYEIYPNRNTIKDDPSAVKALLTMQLESIGRKISSGKGDSLKLIFGNDKISHYPY